MAVQGAERLINQKGFDARPHLMELVESTVVSAPPEVGILRDLMDMQHGSRPQPHPVLQTFVSNNLLGHIPEVVAAVEDLGTTRIQKKQRRIKFDGAPARLSFVTATGEEASKKADNMSGSVWVRDQAFIAKNLLEVGTLSQNPGLVRDGKELLTSLLHCMSTPRQTERFDTVIFEGGNVPPQVHPSIKYDIKRKRHGLPVLEFRTDWGHNQDAWQILAATSLEALDNGWLEAEEIARYSDFFRRIPAFLHEVGYLERESKGSWEEISAKGRLSTIAWEWTSLTRLRKHADLFELGDDAKHLMDAMIWEGAEAIIKRFPDEAAEFHTPDDPAYREADAALIYLGLARLPEQLAALGLTREEFAANPRIAEAMDTGLSPVDAMYSVMLDTLNTLKDPVTGGYARYLGDSYQASQFWLPSVWNNLNGTKGLWKDNVFRDDPGVIHFAGRGMMVEEVNRRINGDGKDIPIARWMHPNTQIAQVCFRKAQETSDPYMKEWYTARGLRDLKDALRMITGEDAYTIKPQDDGVLKVTYMKPGLPPECLVTSLLPDGSLVIHHGPWGPLLWAGAGLGSALAWAGCQN